MEKQGIYDVCVIGTGVTGASIAFELSKYDLKVLVLEKENDVSMKTTKANSAIIHAGYDPLPGTKMARLNVLGSKLVKELQPKLNFHYKNIGSLVVGHTEHDHMAINELFLRGKANNVEGVRILRTAEEVHQIEPHLSKEIDYALYAPSAAIVSPWEMTLALMETAVYNGAELKLSTPVLDITKKDGSFEIKTPDKEYKAKYVINCAGTHADDIYKMALKDKADQSFTIIPCKGEYYLLDKDQGSLVSHTIFQTPTEKGKGVLVSPTVHGNLIVGPNADFEVGDKDDTCSVQKGMDYVRNSALNSVPDISYGSNIRNFAGIRATLKDYSDFLIEESPILKGFINFAGIKSPGLSCGPAFGKEAVDILLASGARLDKKKEFKYYPLPTFFKEMKEDEQIKLIKKDSRYGTVICRCETITEGEIIASMHSLIPAHTLDGVKRRTNTGMGRCQGGFCSPKIFQLLMDECHLSYNEVYQDKDGSQIVICKTKGEK